MTRPPSSEKGSARATFASIEAMAAPRVSTATRRGPAPKAAAQRGGLEVGGAVAQPLRRLPLLAAAILSLAASVVSAAPACAQRAAPTVPPGGHASGVTVADFVTEAAQKFGVPQPWIRAVMRAESAFGPRATSPKGAMGLMQLMPQTWAAMRARLSLGADPYDPHDNILAGVQYLRDLYDQFGAPGFLAAYNAGPGRYLDFLTRGRPLPDETRRYIATVAPSVNGGAPSPAPDAVSRVPGPTLFVAVVVARANAEAAPAPSFEQARPAPFAPPSAANGGLFAGAWGAAPR